MAASKGFGLRRMTVHDITKCAQLAGEAFTNDRQTQFKARSRSDPYHHGEGMRHALAGWVSHPRVDAQVATDLSTDKIVGWVAWSSRGLEHEDQTTSVEAFAVDSTANGGELYERKVTMQDMLAVESSLSDRKKLETITSGDMAAWMAREMPTGTRCMFIMSIVVHPEYQGKGIGSMLMRIGTEKADAQRVKCWVHASEAGWGLFKKHGFQEVGRLVLDLDSCNISGLEPPEGEESWGVYTLRYLRREIQGE